MSTVDASATLLAVALVVLVCQALAAVARRFGQPPVVGEVVGGLLLGPTLFDGWITRTFFPAVVQPALGALANVGVTLFMFLVGLEFDRRMLRRQGRRVGWIGAGSMVVPFGLGALLALWLLRGHPSAHPVLFVVFFGTAMAVTAFPVLARIIVDRGLRSTRVGGLALAIAAAGDVVAWGLLALVVALAGAGGHPWRLLLLVPFLAVMVLVVPWLLRRPVLDRLPRQAVALVVMAGAPAAGAATEWMGLHLIFGAFVLGLVVPRTGVHARFGETLSGSVEPLAAFLMPIYFVVAGFRVDLSRLDGGAVAELLLILLVAGGGKLLGVYGGARAARLDHRCAATLATLMNVRGLTELVLLTVGLSLGILDAGLYGLMVVMAVLTTVVSGPLLHLTTGGRTGCPARGDDPSPDGETIGAVPGTRPGPDEGAHARDR